MPVFTLNALRLGAKTIVFVTGLKDITMTIEMIEHPRIMTLEWNQLKGPFKTNRGRWIISRHHYGSTKGIYMVLLENNSGLPDWILSHIAKSSIPDMFNSIRKQVE